MKRFAIFGASGCGRGVMPLARHQLHQSEPPPWDLVFVDDHPAAPEINGQRVLSYAQWMAEPASSRHVCVAISQGGVRESVVARCRGVAPRHR